MCDSGSDRKTDEKETMNKQIDSFVYVFLVCIYIYRYKCVYITYIERATRFED